ncbi:glutamate receptor ionotropic, delta-2-like [Eriocheir sinensis]|uniref:glutamate receptor ionotropic, delta-2-like n=1 Tax=Eriocheir sinensis TaxID=95602 RepID=UPI0021C949F5|nr:glutamate receptor ionotropic, delta-2-like [Eriocheir sinensis]
MWVFGLHSFSSPAFVWWLCGSVVVSAYQAQTIPEMFRSLVQETLAGDDIMLVLDSGARKELNLEAVAGGGGTMTLLDTDESSSFLETASKRILRGSHFTVILAFTRTPASFLKDLDARWNPDFMLLLSMNSSVNNTALLEDERFQRSQHLTLLELDSKRSPARLRVFSSLPMKGRRFVKLLLGYWNTGFFKNKKDLFPERFETLHGAALQLASWCDDFPFLYPVNGLCKGSSLDMLDVIASHLNFSYDVQMEPSDHEWGKWEGGRWTGMLGDLAYNNKDLVINVFQITQEIFTNFEISYPYHVESYVFLLAKPPPVPRRQGLRYPFTETVILAVLGTSFAVAVLLTLFLRAVPDSQDYSQAFLLVRDHIYFLCLSHLSFLCNPLYLCISKTASSFWINPSCFHCECLCVGQVLAGILRQAVNHRLERWWERVWVGSWWLICVIISTAYTANLVVFLTIPIYPQRIETVGQLASSSLRVAMQDYGSFVPDALNTSQDPSLQQLGANLDLFPYVYLNYEVGFSWVTDRTHSLIETRSYLAYLVGLHNISSVTYVMKEEVFPGYLSWILRKNCPYAARMGRTLQTLVESGLMAFKYRKHKSTASRSQDDQAKTVAGEPLSMSQMLGPFMLLAFGFSIATLVLLGERFIASK